MFMCSSFVFFFFFNDTATTEIYTLSLHDALPISILSEDGFIQQRWAECMSPIDLESALPGTVRRRELRDRDRKSTRLNSSHGYISYAVFCLKKKKTSVIYISIRTQYRKSTV